jgi:thiamine biosynthesis protein ThiI
MYDTVIVRFGEIFLKSDYVKKKFLDILCANIQKKISASGLPGKVIQTRDRIFVKTSKPEKVAAALQSVFGIVSVSPARQIRADMSDIVSASLEVAKSVIKPGDTFAVRAQRSGSHSYKSKDIEMKAGEAIINALNPTVNLSNPDKTIYVEVREELAYVFDCKQKGMGGLPYGSQEGLVGLVSTGIDSPVACWMMMRRGCKMSIVHFGENEEITPVVERLESLVDEKIPVYSLPHHSILKEVSKHTDKYTCIVCKRYMHKAAERVALKIGAYGIVTGENIGQVASQTLENQKLITCTKLPVYRPLVALDKEEIIEYAKKIGTFEYAKTDRCPFVPAKPATRGDEEKIIKIEEACGIAAFLDDVEKNHILKKR